MMGPDETMILHGSRIKGHVSAVGNGFHPRLLLSFDEIETRTRMGAADGDDHRNSRRARLDHW